MNEYFHRRKQTREKLKGFPLSNSLQLIPFPPITAIENFRKTRVPLKDDGYSLQFPVKLDKIGGRRSIRSHAQCSPFTVNCSFSCRNFWKKLPKFRALGNGETHGYDDTGRGIEVSEQNGATTLFERRCCNIASNCGSPSIWPTFIARK